MKWHDKHALVVQELRKLWGSHVCSIVSLSRHNTDSFGLSSSKIFKICQLSPEIISLTATALAPHHFSAVWELSPFDSASQRQWGDNNRIYHPRVYYWADIELFPLRILFHPHKKSILQIKTLSLRSEVSTQIRLHS